MGNLQKKFNLLAEVPTLERKVSRISTLDIDYWGLICKAQVMVNAKINPINVNNNEKDIEIEEIRKHMYIWKDETCMTLLCGSIPDQMLDDAIEVD